MSEENNQIIRDKFWAIVTVFGTLWGGLELTLGTFLHVLHVPKTGFIMVFLCTILLLAQRRIFPARGSTLATGVVAACIKCLSPGGIIAGPVIGILSTALIIELCLLLSSKNLLLDIWAAFMTIMWSQLQFVFKKWIYYGTDFFQSIIKVAQKFVKFEWSATVGWGLVGVFIGIILIFSCIAGFVGWRLGNRLKNQLISAEKNTADTDNTTNTIQTDVDIQVVSSEISEDNAMDIMSKISSGKKRRSSSLSEDAIRSRLYLLIAAVISLVLQFTGDFWLSILALGLWMTALLIGARSVIKAIWWPKFWLITLIISLVCGVILAWQFDKDSVGWQMDWQIGLEASIRMMVRGIYVFSLVTWATRCIRPKEFLSIWNKLKLPGLGHALMRSYALLPIWLDRMNSMVKERPGGFFANIRYSRECCYLCLMEAVKQTEKLAQESQPQETP